MHERGVAGVALVVALGLTGCGGEIPLPNRPVPASTPAAAPTQAPAPTATPGVPEETRAPGTLSGTWSGPVNQPGQPPFTVRVVFSTEGTDVRGVVTYPELGCGGVWRLTDRTGDSFEFLETIDRGRDRCADQVTVRITDNGSSLSYYFNHKGEGRGVLLPVPNP